LLYIYFPLGLYDNDGLFVEKWGKMKMNLGLALASWLGFVVDICCSSVSVTIG